MSSCEPNRHHLREFLIYFFNLKKSAAKEHRLLVETYGEAVLIERRCREWFQKFNNNEFNIEDKERSGRQKVYENAELETLLDQDFCQTQEEKYDGQYSEQNIRFRSFIIIAQVLMKNIGNLFVHLMVKSHSRDCPVKSTMQHFCVGNAKKSNTIQSNVSFKPNFTI